LASAILAMKYQLVASSMQHYVTGNLETKLNERRIKIFYFLFMMLGIFGFFVFTVFCVQKSNGKDI